MISTSASVGYYTTWNPSAGVDIDGALLEVAYVEGNSLAAVNQTTRTAQKLCEKGAYCVGGIKRFCASGVYGDAEGLSTAQCSAPCPAGYFWWVILRVQGICFLLK